MAPAGVTLEIEFLAAIGDIEVAGGVDGQATGLTETGQMTKVETAPAGVTLEIVLPQSLETKRLPAALNARPWANRARCC